MPCFPHDVLVINFSGRASVFADFSNSVTSVLVIYAVLQTPKSLIWLIGVIKKIIQLLLLQTLCWMFLKEYCP